MNDSDIQPVKSVKGAPVEQDHVGEARSGLEVELHKSTTPISPLCIFNNFKHIYIHIYISSHPTPYQTMETLTSRSAYTKILMDDGLVILEGITKTCPNCKAIAPTVDKMIKKYPEARFFQYDVDDQEAIAQELGVNLVPHFTVLRDGNKEASVTGAKVRELEKVVGENYKGRIVEGVE